MNTPPYYNNLLQRRNVKFSAPVLLKFSAGEAHGLVTEARDSMTNEFLGYHYQLELEEKEPTHLELP